MHPKQENGIGEERRPDGSAATGEVIRLLLACSPDQKRVILYELLSSMLGSHPAEEVGVYDPDGGIYGYFLPPQLRLQLQLLEDPEFNKELDRRLAAGGSACSLRDFLQRLASTQP